MNRKNRIAAAADRLRKKGVPKGEERFSPAKRRVAQRSSQPRQEQIVLDERVPGLLLDAISSVNAATASAIMGLPYSEARQAAAPNEEEKRELTCAVREVAEKHPEFFKQNKVAIEFGVAWAAVHAKHFDNLLTRCSDTLEESACLPLQVLVLVAVVLAPLLILVVVAIAQDARRV